MSVQLIGAALPRTGTMSVKRALEAIGFGKCYHMHEVLLNPAHVPVWRRAVEGLDTDWHALFDGYSATLDGPACFYWKEQLEAFPEARVLLLERDANIWYDSVLSTVYPVLVGEAGIEDAALDMVSHLLLDTIMQGRFLDREYAITVFNQYCEEVRESVPSTRLLCFGVSQGWRPLCEFLGYDMPPEPFPMTNTRAEFGKRSGLE